MSEIQLEHISVIKFLLGKEGNRRKNIHQRMINVYGKDIQSYFTIKFWSRQFRWGKESISDAEGLLKQEPTKTSRKLRFWS
jgi:hypothetical protein